MKPSLHQYVLGIAAALSLSLAGCASNDRDVSSTETDHDVRGGGTTDVTGGGTMTDRSRDTIDQSPTAPSPATTTGDSATNPAPSDTSVNTATPTDPAASGTGTAGSTGGTAGQTTP